MSRDPVLSVSDLTISFGGASVVEGVSFDVMAGETLGIVGESGSGKSMTALAIMRLLPPPGRVAGGAISFMGRNLLALPERDMRAVRGRDMAMVFQEPMTSLNPVFTIGEQIAETLRRHRGLSRRAAQGEAVRLLKRVEIASAERRVGDYPHQLSGGMRQRVMLAIALACGPKLLVADEPTTALDATIQAQLLDLLRQLQREFGMAVLFITHDLGVIAEFASRAVVLYAGRVAEIGPVEPLFRRPRHPYTEGLLASIPRLAGPLRRLNAIPGGVPRPSEMPAGCRFAPRCGYRIPVCEEQPPLLAVEPGHLSACFRHEDVGNRRDHEAA